MKKIVLMALTIVGLSSCNNKELHLTKGAFTDVEIVDNNSPIYLEKDPDTNELVENQNSRIAGTNYIFAVERSLNLYDVAQSVTRIKAKKYDPENMHADELGVYFSYADTLNKKMAFYNFKDLDFGFQGPSALQGVVYVLNKDTLIVEGRRIGIADFPQAISQKDSLQLGFNKDLDFETYLSTRLYLKQNNLDPKFNATDLIY